MEWYINRFFHVATSLHQIFLFPLNIPAGEDHILYISWLATIVDGQLQFILLIHVPHEICSEQLTVTFATHVVLSIAYLYYIVFDWDSLLISSHFQLCIASKEIKLEPFTMHYPQTDGQLEIVYIEIKQVARACMGEGIRWWIKLLDLQLGLNSP